MKIGIRSLKSLKNGHALIEVDTKEETVTKLSDP